jgi:hypothetical protein
MVRCPHQNYGKGRQQQADLEQVNPNEAQNDPAQAAASALPFENSAKGQHCRHSGKQHEYLRGIREAKIAQGDRAERVAGDVIDKYHQQRNAAQYVDPRIALGFDH